MTLDTPWHGVRWYSVQHRYRWEVKLAIVVALVLVVGILVSRRRPRSSPRAVSGLPETWKVEDRWSVYQAAVDEKPIFTRLNEGLEPYVGHPEFRNQLGIAVRLKNPTGDGLPTSEESTALNQIENEIVRRFLPGNECLLAAVVTARGTREFVLYTSDPDAARTKAAALARENPRHRIQFVVRDDPGWSQFRTLAPEG